MAPTRTPTRRALLSVNTLSLLSIIEFSLPTEATVSTAQGPDIPGDVEVIIPELQPFAIEQQPMTKGKARVIAKYQITTDSPTLYLVANTVEEVFLRRSPVVVSSKSDSTPRSPSALSYTSECPKEQSVPWTEQLPSPELTTHPINIAELIEFTKTQNGFNTIVNIVQKKDQSLLEALLRFKNYYHLREEIIKVGAAIFYNIQQQKKVEDEAKKLRII